MALIHVQMTVLYLMIDSDQRLALKSWPRSKLHNSSNKTPIVVLQQHHPHTHASKSSGISHRKCTWKVTCWTLSRIHRLVRTLWGFQSFLPTAPCRIPHKNINWWISETQTPEDLSALLKTEMPLMAWNAPLYSEWGKKQREDACNYQG